MHTKSRTKTSRRFSRAVCDTLEDRQLMSLTIEVRSIDGSATATATSVGQVLTLDVLAVVSSSSNDPTQDGLQDVAGSFVSTANGNHSVTGDMTATNLTPFKALGAFKGTNQDLNGDGNVDVGSNDPITTANYFFARASAMQGSSTGTIVGNTLVFDIATINYTVTSLKSGGQTSVNFVPYVSQAPEAAGWAENGVGVDNVSGVFQAGSPFVISDPILLSAPTAVNDSATVAENTSTNLYVLSNDDVINPLNPSSIVVSNPAHGTAVAVAEGSVIYTPFTNFTGNDSFTYSVADNGGRVSNTATVSVHVVSTPAPVAGAVTVNSFRNQTANINVLSHVTSQGTVVPAAVSVIIAPLHGTTAVQSDGSINYIPGVNFIGSDSFQYTAGDSNNETSNPATVNITVSIPQPPVAHDDNLNVSAGSFTVIDLQTNDTPGSVALADLVRIASQPAHGTVTTQTGGNVRYTPATGYSGSDSFTYVDADVLGNLSSLATVHVTVTAGLPPTSNDVVAQLPSGQATSIDVLTNNPGAIPTTVKVAAAPTNGTASANADGTISYTSVAGFVGSDSFTYTFADTGGGTSAPATVDVQVGATISNAKGAAHSLRFTNAAGGIETISLNVGTANIYFAGNGSLTVARNGKATVTGAGTNLTSIALSNTTRASSLSIKGSPKTPVNLGGIIDASAVGNFIAPSANITGDINLNGAGSISVGNITNSTISIGSGIPNRFSLSAAIVTGSSLSSAVPNTSIKSLSWAGAGPITATSINSLTIKTGGLSSNISTGSIGSINIGGPLTANITATSAKSIKITGDINGSTLSIAGLLGQLKVTSNFISTTIVAGRINALSLGTINTNNAGRTFGVTAPTIGSFTGIFGSTPLHLGRAQLSNASVLQAYAAQQGAVFGNFAIQL